MTIDKLKAMIDSYTDVNEFKRLLLKAKRPDKILAECIAVCEIDEY